MSPYDRSRRRAPRPTPDVLSPRRHEPQVKKAAGRSLSDFEPLYPGEAKLLRACREGEAAELGTEVPDEAPSDDVRVRAAFVRFLLLGGDENAPLHERGVNLRGAFIDGRLDLGGCCIPHNVVLVSCRFDEPLFALDAYVQGLMTLEGSHLLQGIHADRLKCDGGLFLRGGFKSTGQVRLHGAQIGGDLSCRGGQFEVREGEALWADGAVVKGGVYLNGGFKVTGEVRLLGAQIGGNLECRGGQFEIREGDALSADRAVVKGGVFLNGDFKTTGQVRLLGAQIGGNLVCSSGRFEASEGNALLANRASVAGGWFLDGLKSPARVDAGHMQVGVLIDSIESWAEGSVLDGLRYDTFGGLAPTQAHKRLDWLGKQRADHLGTSGAPSEFRPQLWRQLQRVLREMGHLEDARQIGIGFERQLRRADRIGLSPPGTWAVVAGCKRLIARAAHWLFDKLAGYGYRPMRLMTWMVLVWLVFGIGYWLLALPPHDAIGPSDPLVFQNSAYETCFSGSAAASAAKARGEPYPGNWYLCSPLPADYSTLSPLAYSLDILLPLVDLGQEKAWGPRVPTPEAHWWREMTAFSAAHVVRWMVWVETIFGWVASLLLVAIVSGVARRSEE